MNSDLRASQAMPKSQAGLQKDMPTKNSSNNPPKSKKPVSSDLKGQSSSQEIALERIFFKSLNKKSTRADLEAVFCKYGEIEYLKLPFNFCKERNLGYGFIIYKDDKVTQHLLHQVKEVMINGKMISLTAFSEDDKNKSKKSKVAQVSGKSGTLVKERTQDEFSHQAIISTNFGKETALQTSQGQYDASSNEGYHSIRPCEALYFSDCWSRSARRDHHEHNLGFKMMRLPNSMNLN